MPRLVEYVDSFAENNEIIFWYTGKIIETFNLHSRCVGGNATKNKPSGHSHSLPGVRPSSLSIWAAVPDFAGNGFNRATAVQSAGGRAVQCLLGKCCFLNLRRSANGKVVLTQGSLQFSCTKVSYPANFTGDLIKRHLNVQIQIIPHRIGPVSGILKKPQIPLKPNGKLWSGKKNFLFDSSLEEKLASMRKDCANQTALNSVYNQFLGAGK